MRCDCGGEYGGVRDWWGRVTGRSTYIYAWRMERSNVSGVPNGEVKQGYYVTRRLVGVSLGEAQGSDEFDLFQRQCICGAWLTPRKQQQSGISLMPVESPPGSGQWMRFEDPRDAQQHLNELRNGIPHRWPLLAVAGALIAAAGGIAEIISAF